MPNLTPDRLIWVYIQVRRSGVRLGMVASVY